MPNHPYIRKTARYNGKKYEATGKTEREAMLKLAEKLAAAKRGEETIDSNMTVDSWYKRWKSLYKDPKGLTAKSLGMYDEKYNGYIKPRIGSLRLKDVTEVHLQAVLNEQAGKSSSHLKKIRMVLQELFRKARQTRLIIYDPAETLELPNCTKGERRSVTEDERKAILEVADTHRAGLWIKTLLYTGMRPGETATLCWVDVDLDEGVIHVHTARESGSTRTKDPKTTAGIRDIPIHAELLPLLREGKKSAPTPFSPVFPTQSGGWQNENSLRRLWTGFRRDLDIYCGAEVYRNKIVRSALADDLVPYCLRHTFCTDLQKAGVPINVAKELMGHSDIQTTANIYTHRDLDTLRHGISLLDGTEKNKAREAADQ